VNDGEARIYRAGESWFEPPGASHPVSRNASKTKPAKLLAVFIVDSGEKGLTTPVKQRGPSAGPSSQSSRRLQ